MVDLVQEKRLSLKDHLQELRNRLIYFIIFFIGAFIISFFFQEYVMDFISRPHVIAMKKLGRGSDFVALYYPEKFMAYFKLNLIAALIFAAPFGLWQAWRFIGVALYKKERKAILTYLPLSIILFLSGVVFSYLYLIPTALEFLAGYGSENIKLFLSLNGYLSLFIILTLALGVSFELPLLMLFFSVIGLTTVGFYVKKIRLAIVLILIFAAIITPTGDAITFLIFAFPLFVLYAFGILLVLLFQKKAKKE